MGGLSRKIHKALPPPTMQLSLRAAAPRFADSGEKGLPKGKPMRVSFSREQQHNQPQQSP